MCKQNKNIYSKQGLSAGDKVHVIVLKESEERFIKREIGRKG
jgi:hypothetical protein